MIQADFSKITLEEYLEISKVVAGGNASDYVEILSKYGADKKDLQEMDLEEEVTPIVEKFIEDVNRSFKREDLEQSNSIEVNGRIYEAERTESGKIKVNPRDQKNVSSLLSKYTGKEAILALAVLWKDAGANKEANYSEAAIKHRAEVFLQQPARKFVLALIEANVRLSEVVKGKTKEEPKEENISTSVN